MHAKLQMLILTCTAFVVAAGGTYFFTSASQTFDDDPAQVAAGAVQYAAHCASCHGAKGEGQSGWETNSTAEKPLAPAHDATGHTWQHPDSSIFDLIKTGISDTSCITLADDAMPRFNNALSDHEILDIIAYLKSTWPRHIREQHEAINRQYGETGLLTH